MNILLGVTGGIAAYKSCEFCSMAIKAGHQIQVVQTKNASRFVGAITFEGLTGRRVLNNTFEAAMDHIEWAKWADIVVVAPLSANTLAKIAHGLCDDLLSTTLCATPKQTPILLCPAMNTHMWVHPLTQRNVDILTATHRFDWKMPVEKRLACGDVGVGGLVDPIEILQHCESLC
jgi:phosphopantothenoylcysteine decarboxylase / phosphopantothenate---cysteine ligase